MVLMLILGKFCTFRIKVMRPVMNIDRLAQLVPCFIIDFLMQSMEL
jgi:hypothetical protein